MDSQKGDKQTNLYTDIMANEILGIGTNKSYNSKQASPITMITSPISPYQSCVCVAKTE